ncbi:hypothetical protein BCR35DRAFT_310696 [Leucosporidium creatinivorum]|uniref:Uncharacterized protein n=1 Tax=Leucosporidium creatinivorum TaxID=106004 RepID=A0A1Y2CXS8_9BASI|nr:hypothetical protein BCR35DRAFT_310696 [Leucosporidium creatinivorum]
MAGLPTPPDGVNPYLYYDSLIEGLVMPRTSPGFQVRLLVTFCLFLFFGIASLLAFTVHCVAQRRLGRQLWLIRVVRRDGGSFLVGNHLALIGAAGIVFPVVCCGAIWTTERFYIQRTEVHSITDWRLAIWAPSFVCGWAISWSSLHSYLHVVGDKTPRWMVKGGIFNFLNIFSIGGGTIITLLIIVLSVVGARTGHRVSDHYDAFHTFLEQAAASWQPGVEDQVTMARSNELSLSYGASVESYFVTFETLLSIHAAISVVIMIVTCGTLALVLILRRQIRMSLEDLKQTATRIEELGDSVAGPPTRRGASQQRWQAQVRKAARGEDVEGLHMEQARRIDDLRKVEKERIIICFILFTMSLLLFTQNVFTLVTLRDLGSSWPRTEFALTFTWWFSTVVASAGAIAHLWVEIRHFPPPRSSLSGDGSTSPSQKPTALQSLSQQIHIDIQVHTLQEIDSDEQEKERGRSGAGARLQPSSEKRARSVSFRESEEE